MFAAGSDQRGAAELTFKPSSRVASRGGCHGLRCLLRRRLSASKADGASRPDGFVQAALKWFRLGVIERQVDDQFMKFWLSLEIVAEGMKEKERVPINCPKCQTGLVCTTCGPALRVPMATQAIRALIREVCNENAAAQLESALPKARNWLMHGRDWRRVQADLKLPFAYLVDSVAFIAWECIYRAAPAEFQERADAFGHRGGKFANLKHSFVPVGEFEHHGAGDHPEESQLPAAQITMVPVRREKDAAVGGGENAH